MTTRARYTLEHKQEAVRLVEGGQAQASVAKPLGLVEQRLFNWVKLSRRGQIKGADSKPVSADGGVREVLARMHSASNDRSWPVAARRLRCSAHLSTLTRSVGD